MMCLHVTKKSKPLAESLGTKQSCKSSYTIPKGPLYEKRGEHVKTKIKFLSIQNKIFLWIKIVDKRGEVNLSQWMKMAKGHNVLS